LCYGAGLLEVTDANGCQYSISYFVDDSNTFPTPVQAWADRYLIYANETVDLYATELGPGFTYRWSPADCLTPAQGTHVKAVPEDTTTFTVTVEDIFYHLHRPNIIVVGDDSLFSCCHFICRFQSVRVCLQ
jgi:hypothetical protein